ncbi:aa3-type cytochrome c oxidase subunit IV [uncultured Caulobacter sp.]|uniref:aa3-type cytochrome c oxidase subunit IV n=1 Tax=uncultured Caulobacter sp. TaxID=158749 RepID=UPI0026268068|nr:aa3-type cytochrome c oxidase subunit IV [uncultured Caulobacter sp.]
MAAIEPDLDRQEILVEHEKTYHAFSVLLRWAMLALAAGISGLTVWFATPGGFWGGLVVIAIVWVAGYYGMVRREEQQPLDPWVPGRKGIL